MKRFCFFTFWLAVAAAGAEKTAWKLEFGTGALQPAEGYTVEKGCGFEPMAGAAPEVHAGSLVGTAPFAYSVAVPEGLYRVTVVLGDEREATLTTVEAEARRLLLARVAAAPGEALARSFTVAVKRPPLRSGQSVRLKGDEQNHRDWDEKLTLEFSGPHPGVRSVEIAPAPAGTPTLFIAGDSTVTDQPRPPYVGWGQMLPCFFGPGLAVANHAESGEALRSFQSAGRFEKIFETMRPGDFLLLQFGHNDQKDKAPGAGPYTTYQEMLRQAVARTRERQGRPIIVTSMERRHFVGSKIEPSLTDFAEAARQVSYQEEVPLIDLQAASIRLYETLGPEGSLKAFVHFPANTFPGQAVALKDDTHFTAYGAYELARCVAEAIRAQKLAPAAWLAPAVLPFDPARPDAPEALALPVGGGPAGARPEGQ